MPDSPSTDLPPASSITPSTDSDSVGEPPRSRNRGSLAGRIALFLGFLIFLGVFFHFAREKAAKDNTGVSERGYHVVLDYDQQPYMNVARKLRDTHFEWITPRHRMPGFSLMLIPFYDPETAYPIDPTGKDDRRVSDGFFDRAKLFSTLLACAVLVGLFAFCRRWMPIFGALIVTAAFAFLLAVFKAPYVQPEVFFYLLFTISFVLLIRQVESPSWWNGALAGLALASTFILKSAVIPLIALFLACYGAKLLIDLLIGWRKGKALGVKTLAIRVGQACLPIIVFCALLSPYLITTWKLFGSPFWDVHSRYYMWMDTEEDKYKWRNLEISEPGFQAPAGEEAPNFKKFVREHSWSQVVDRIENGKSALSYRLKHDYEALYDFLRQYIWRVSLIIGILHWREVLNAIRKHWAALLMVVGFFTGYSLLYSWYSAIRVGPRLILGLALPLIFLGVWFVNRFGGTVRIPWIGGSRQWQVQDGRIANVAIAVGVLIYGWEVLSEDLWRIEGGQ